VRGPAALPQGAGTPSIVSRCVRRSLAIVVLAITFSGPSTAGEQVRAAWSQWGGPNRDFQAPAGDLESSWPEGGPERLWARALGEGYSAILVENGRLYTMYRGGGDEYEIVICLDAATGETLWEYRYREAPHDRHVDSFGRGPSSTPLLVGNKLFTIGVAGSMHALNKNNGAVIWSRELWGDEFNGNVLAHGYSSSPVAYKDSVIVPVGGERAALVAFNQKDGSLKWRALSFRNSYSSPSILNIADEAEVVVFMAEELIGVNPDDGALRWRYPHANQWNHNITMPTLIDHETIMLSSPQAGARGLKVRPNGGSVTVEEIWSNRRIQFYHASTVREGDWVYGSTGTMAVTFMAAVNARTGEIGWRERGFAKANCVASDGKLLILDENGMLSIASASPEELVVHSTADILGGRAWTVPSVVGTTLYARDNSRIVAIDLGRHAQGGMDNHVTQ